MRLMYLLVLEKDKKELQATLLQADKDRKIATQKEADLAKKVRVTVLSAASSALHCALRYYRVFVLTAFVNDSRYM